VPDAVTAAPAAPPVPDPIDWGIAARIGRLVAGRDALADSYLGASLVDDFSTLTPHAEDLVASFTGLRPPGRVECVVLDRRGWVDANIASMRHLLAPLMQRVGSRLARSPIAPVGRRVAATEVGALVGYLSQRVLGQYDLLVPDDDAPDAVYYVGPNILSLEKRFAFRPRDFRLWIAIHEVTHRAQFAGVPWMREHFFGLVQQAFEVVDPDPKSLVRALSRAVAEVRQGRNPLDEGGLVGLFATDEQRAVLQQVQALMSLLEGHGDFVMDEIGREHVHGVERMSRVLSARREVRGVLGHVHKLLGIEQKLRQYETGERFIRGVVDIAGVRAIDNAWRSPQHLPTQDELADPERWLRRVERSDAVG
jgi:coenzyme F420 biosynthesis associated uncharacterized protein